MRVDTDWSFIKPSWRMMPAPVDGESVTWRFDRFGARRWNCACPTDVQLGVHAMREPTAEGLRLAAMISGMRRLYEDVRGLLETFGNSSPHPVVT